MKWSESLIHELGSIFSLKSAEGTYQSGLKIANLHISVRFDRKNAFFKNNYTLEFKFKDYQIFSTNISKSKEYKFHCQICQKCISLKTRV